MMYAILADGGVQYLGGDRNRATEILDSKDGGKQIVVASLDELADALRHHRGEDPPNFSESLSDAFSEVMAKLDDLGINKGAAEEFGQRVQDNTAQITDEVRSLGIKGMKAVGANFVALGDLLKKAAEEKLYGDDKPTDTDKE